MEEILGLLLYLGCPSVLLLLGWTVGTMRERGHFRSLVRREKKLADMLVTDLKHFPAGADPEAGTELVLGEAVIATDYMKSFLARLKKLIGGELKGYNALMTRARREAMVRMLTRARERGFNAVCNVRITSADIGGSSGPKGAVMASILVFGTAYRTRER